MVPSARMALVTCPDCAREISDAAPSCPGCGRPMHESRPTAETATNGEPGTKKKRVRPPQNETSRGIPSPSPQSIAAPAVRRNLDPPPGLAHQAGRIIGGMSKSSLALIGTPSEL